MKLYLYDHCPFCTRAHMIFGLKNIPVEVDYFLENDVDSPTELVGKKITPILRKTDGSHMPESMDIVHYVDALEGERIVKPLAEDNPYKNFWDKVAGPIFRLAIPRLTEADLPEFATAEAREAFRVRQTKNFGDYSELIEQTPELIKTVEQHLADFAPTLAERDGVSEGDFFAYPLLRALTIVKGINYPAAVKAYIEDMAKATNTTLYTDMAR